MAVGPAGHVYVADYFNGRIQRFSHRGRFLGQWAAFDPYGLATDSDGRVYVAEYYGGRVEKFSAEGRFLRMWGWGVRDGSNEFQRCGPPRAACLPGLGGSGEGQFAGPQGVATDSAHHVYVADAGNHRIQKFSAGGRFLTAWGEFGDGRGQFKLATDVATNSAGRVYVADQVNDRIVKYAQIPPQTKITASWVRDARRRAKFRFKASEPGSRFRCRLDRRRVRPCDSPRTYRDLGAGEHVFRVRAIGPDELRDRTAAKERFRITN